MSMTRRRLMRRISSTPSVLPSEYQQVEYLYSDGDSWIDSGVECTSDLVVEFDCLFSSNVNASMCGGIDTRNAPVYFRHHFSPYNSKSAYWICNESGGSTGTVQISCYKDVRHHIFVDPVNGNAIVDDTSISFEPLATQEILTTGRSYGIFARISDAGAIQSRPSYFYYFKFYRNGSIIGNFIPCYRKSDNVIGMYDTVSQTFFTNAGTGDFTKGADV